MGLKMAMNLAHHLLISSAIDCYAVGRYAVFAGLNPTAGNLLHHAVEMCLKGALAKKGKSPDDLIRHRLRCSSGLITARMVLVAMRV